MKKFDGELPADLQAIASVMEDQRPELTDAEYTRVRRRVLASQRGQFMKSRIAITAMLATGVLMSGGGAALGVSALSSTNDASVAQYGAGGTAGQQNQQGCPPAQSARASQVCPSQSSPEVLAEGTAGDDVGGDVAPATTPAQVDRQLGAEESGDALPFTGFAAIPMVLAGLALLAAGLALRRSTRRSELF